MAVDVVPPLPATTHGADGGAAAAGATAADAAPSLLAPVSGIVCIFVSAFVSELLSYYVSLGISLACFARAVWPDRVDAVLVPLGAHARRAALLARADLETDLRRLRAHPATAPACDAVARWAGAARRRAVAKWAEHKAAAGVAWFLLRLAGRAARIAATVLLDAAREEAAAHAPAAMAYLRGLVPGGISSPATSSNEGEQAKEEDDIAGLELRDVVSLVGIAFYLLFSIRFVLSFGTMSGKQFYGMFLVMCGLAVMTAEWINPPDDDDSDTTAGDRSADETTQQEGGDAGDQARLDAELEEVRGSWQFMYALIFMAFCFDAFLLHATFGPQPTLLLLLAVCNFWVLGIGKDIQLAPEDGEGAEGRSAASAEAAAVVDEAVNTWRWGAVWVFVASSVKVLAIFLVVDFYVAALSSLWLCLMADLLLTEEDSLLELYESGGDEDREEGDAGSGEDVNGGAEEGADEASAGAAEHSDTSSSEDEEEDYVLEERCNSSEEHSNTNLSEDEEEDYVLEERCDSSEERTNAISSEDEEEDYVLEERCDSSEERVNATSSEDEAEGAAEEHCDGSEEHEHLEEQRQEELDCSSGGSMDDGWDFVEVDPEMLVKDNTGANRKSSSLLPWK
ncbi:unnamed protein product [Urochloa decumbens]|uniref:Uncharacterized protein n=1 Tax=Urochloa decumbens TaxID=240449 RepID=A0ABC9D3W7_9POAL